MNSECQHQSVSLLSLQRGKQSRKCNDCNQLIKSDSKHVCSICGTLFIGWGNNSDPVIAGICCDSCNWNLVIPKRLIKEL